MKFVVKYFSEIAIKSKPVRRSFVDKLASNLRALLREFDPDVVVRKNWDRLLIQTRLEDAQIHRRMIEAMCNTPGITYILEVNEHVLPPVEDMTDLVLPVYQERLEGRSFAVRCKRSGVHDFTSLDVEREVGGALLARSGASGVNLKIPEVTVELEVSKHTLCDR